MAEGLIDIGTTEGLRFRIEWPHPVSGKTAAEQTRGQALLWGAGELVWGRQVGSEFLSFHWTWIELLEFLAESWSHIEVTGAYPCELHPTAPSLLRAAARERWRTMPEDQVLDEEIEVFAFENHHDLAQGLQGAVAPSLWLVRDRDSMMVATRDRTVRIPAVEVIGSLAQIGDAIMHRCALCADPRAQIAIEEWKTRTLASPREIIPPTAAKAIGAGVNDDPMPVKEPADYHM